jgi:hypothetical protein
MREAVVGRAGSIIRLADSTEGAATGGSCNPGVERGAGTRIVARSGAGVCFTGSGSWALVGNGRRKPRHLHGKRGLNQPHRIQKTQEKKSGDEKDLADVADSNITPESGMSQKFCPRIQGPKHRRPREPIAPALADAGGETSFDTTDSLVWQSHERNSVTVLTIRCAQKLAKAHHKGHKGHIKDTNEQRVFLCVPLWNLRDLRGELFLSFFG